MSGKGTMRKGGVKKTGQRFQNVTAFRHNKNSKTTKKIEELPVNGLCPRCTEIIHWRKAYRKYKPLTAARKCTACQQKTVRDAYHVLCQPCATERGVCAKCLVSGEVVASTVKTAAEMNRERIEMENMVAGMSERERRSFLRRIAREGEEGEEGESETEHSEDGRSDDEDDHCGHSDDDDDDANASDSSVVEAVGRVQLASQQSDDAETVSDKDDESSSS